MTEPNESTPPEVAADPGADYARRLLHRWFVEYNPLYLLSAALVLGGTFLCSRGLTQDEGQYGPLGVSAIAEIYAACLIGGAALLTRIGQRRPAVMLAMLTLLYQWDLTLHTERTPYLGLWAAGAWLMLFVVKLHVLGWAMRLRLSRSAQASAILAAAGLAFFPAHLPYLTPGVAGALLSVWVFALASLQPSSALESLVALEGWGATVLGRGARAAWLLSVLVVSGHVYFWSSQYQLQLALLLPVVPLLLLRRVRSEGRVWALAAATLVLVAATMPAAFAVTALLAAVALALRALAPVLAPEVQLAKGAARSAPPYRGAAPEADAEPPPIQVVLVPVQVEAPEIKRLLVGAALSLYLAAWTLGWSGGPWPAHVMALDLALTVVLLGAAWKARVPVAVVPTIATWFHLVAQAGLLPVPRSPLQWGVSAVGLGFVLLAGSLFGSYRLRTTDPS